MRPDLDAIRADYPTQDATYVKAEVVPVLLDYIRELEESLLWLAPRVTWMRREISPSYDAAAKKIEAVLAEVRGGC